MEIVLSGYRTKENLSMEIQSQSVSGYTEGGCDDDYGCREIRLSDGREGDWPVSAA